jgi:hypothetical protein
MDTNTTLSIAVTAGIAGAALAICTAKVLHYLYTVYLMHKFLSEAQKGYQDSKDDPRWMN